ncbi:MAG: hypothetical protein KJN77_05165 [Gammaproteobacteria bacterium]|nr:hypothetical protein [Gammaproteobacteria bacterium]
MTSLRSQLERLEALRETFGAPAAREKLALLVDLEQQSFGRATDVERLHEALCFSRAWPDSPQLLTTVNRMLKNFAARADLQRFAGALENSGIAGTDIRFQFYRVTAQWLAERCGDALHIDWKRFDGVERLSRTLGSLALFSERGALQQYLYDAADWIDRMRADDETDAAFLVRRFAALVGDEALRDSVYDELEIPFHLSPSATTPTRAQEYLRPKAVQYQRRNFKRKAVDLQKAASRRIRFEKVQRRQAIRLVDLARSAMVARSRDLDAFAYASAKDVLRVHCRNGIQLVLIGMLPEKRYLLECEYGYLMLRNGVVVGYGTGTGLFGSCQIAFNLFPTFRGAETTELYASVLAAFHRLFAADTFSVDSYQIGADNEEAIDSGAWWFYARMGFRPRDKEASKLADTELRKAQERKGYRSSKNTLRQLAVHPLYFSLGRKRKDVLPMVCTDTLSLGVLDYVSKRFGSQREDGARRCSEELAGALGIESTAEWTTDEQLMWHRLGPVIAAVTDVTEWPRADRDALLDVIRAKGGVHEKDYVTLFDAHRRLRRAVAAFAANAAESE